MIATCADTAALPLPASAPPSAVVVAASVLVAVIVRSSTPVRTESSARPAVVVSLTTLSANEAPTPVVSPPCFFAVAIAWLSRFDVAASVRSPLTATGSVPSTTAAASETTTLTASEPATPTLLPPAPEVACALKVDAPDPAVASIVRLPAVTLTFFDT